MTDDADQQAEMDLTQQLQDLEDQVVAYSANLRALKDREIKYQTMFHLLTITRIGS